MFEKMKEKVVISKGSKFMYDIIVCLAIINAILDFVLK